MTKWVQYQYNTLYSISYTLPLLSIYSLECLILMQSHDIPMEFLFILDILSESEDSNKNLKYVSKMLFRFFFPKRWFTKVQMQFHSEFVSGWAAIVYLTDI